MAKKKTKAAKTPTKRKASPPAKVRTAFMAAFMTEFIRNSKTKMWKWPVANETLENIVADFETFIDVLLRSAVLIQPVPPDNSGSLKDRLAKFLKAQEWPVSSAIPPKWREMQPTVRVIEIAVIQDRLLEAINIHRRPPGSAGGPGPGWPPH